MKLLKTYLFSLGFSALSFSAIANNETPVLKSGTPDINPVYNFNFDWKFMPGEIVDASSANFDDSSWQKVNLPHDFQIQQPWVEPSADEKPDLTNSMANVVSRLSSRGFKEMGKGTYRKVFTPDESWKGRRVLLDFEGIMFVGDAYLNGQPIGKTDYGYLGFESDVTKLLKYGEPNVITVIADTRNPENSRWYTGGGLYRDVNVKVTDPKQYFTRHSIGITTPVVDPAHSTVVVGGEIATFVKTDSIHVGIEIFDAEGNNVYSSRKGHWSHPRQHVREFRLDSIPLENVTLWDTENPYLYTMDVTLYRPDGSVADKATERFGIRKVEFSPEYGMKLNGKKVLLKGIANHHTLGALGAAAYPKAMEKRIKMLKDFGFNHIRTSHNPYSESFLDLCDENGILVVDELYDKWTDQHTGGRSTWMELWQKNVPEWIKRDRNHPSVVLWSLGNELQLIPDMPFNDWGVTPYHLQKQLLNRYDDSRLVTVAMHPRGRNELTDSLPAPLALETDIAAYNYRYMYFPGDSRNFPWMIFYQSEANTSALGPNWFEMDLDKVTGAAYWGMIDYLGESLGWPAKGWVAGVFDISLEPKPTAYFVKSFFQPDKPMVYVAPFTDGKLTDWNDVKVGSKNFSGSWNYNPGDTVKLYTYTNADEVELLINGKKFGRKANDVKNPKKRNQILWDKVPYSKGKVEAVAYINGKEVARHSLSTNGNAKKLAATADNASWAADGMDLQHVKIEAVDSKGLRDRKAKSLLNFSVEGPADIVGVINGDNTSNELTVGDSRSLYQGTATVILRSRREAGSVTLKVNSELGNTSVKLQTK